MKIEYKFVDGTVTEIEVEGSLGEFMLELKMKVTGWNGRKRAAMSSCQRLIRKTAILTQGGTRRGNLPEGRA